jgi:cell wall-associated NlpC family hydrolase
MFLEDLSKFVMTLGYRNMLNKCGALCLLALLVSCGTAPPQRTTPEMAAPALAPQSRERAAEVVIYALGLMDIDYRFGGKNPESGLDCSGMVSYIYRHALGIELPHNAARIAQIGREIAPDRLAPGDLVFFNTTGKPFSHVGIYLGNDRFIHAPSSNGKIKVSSLKATYYATRLEAARTLFD